MTTVMQDSSVRIDSTLEVVRKKSAGVITGSRINNATWQVFVASRGRYPCLIYFPDSSQYSRQNTQSKEMSNERCKSCIVRVTLNVGSNHQVVYNLAVFSGWGSPSAYRASRSCLYFL